MGYRWGGEVSKLSVAQPALGREWRNLLAVFFVLLLAGCGGMSKVGDLFSGTYYLTAVTHLFDDIDSRAVRHIVHLGFAHDL